MKYLFRAIFEKLIEKPINAFIHKKSEEKETTFDKNNFVAYYAPGKIVLSFLLLLACLGVTYAFYSVDKTIDVIVKVCLGFSFVAFLTFIYLLTYRCCVDETGFTVKKIFAFKRFVPRADFFDVEIISWEPRNSDKDGLLIIKNKNGKKIFTASKDLVGFGLMCKMAKRFERKKQGEPYDKHQTN